MQKIKHLGLEPELGPTRTIGFSLILFLCETIETILDITGHTWEQKRKCSQKMLQFDILSVLPAGKPQQIVIPDLVNTRPGMRPGFKTYLFTGDQNLAALQIYRKCILFGPKQTIFAAPDESYQR